MIFFFSGCQKYLNPYFFLTVREKLIRLSNSFVSSVGLAHWKRVHPGLRNTKLYSIITTELEQHFTVAERIFNPGV